MGLEFFWDGLFGGWRCVPPFSGLGGTSVHHGQARSFLGLVEGIEQVANGIPPLGKCGFIHVELWRLAWDGLQGGFCGKYREYLQENQRSRPPKPGDHEPR